jgi:hypothetical protein
LLSFQFPLVLSWCHAVLLMFNLLVVFLWM